MADEGLEEEKRKPGRACEGSRQDLIKCLRESDCVKVVRGVVDRRGLVLIDLSRSCLGLSQLFYSEFPHGWINTEECHRNC